MGMTPVSWKKGCLHDHVDAAAKADLFCNVPGVDDVEPGVFFLPEHALRMPAGSLRWWFRRKAWSAEMFRRRLGLSACHIAAGRTDCGMPRSQHG